MFFRYYRAVADTTTSATNTAQRRGFMSTASWGTGAVSANYLWDICRNPIGGDVCCTEFFPSN